MNRRLEAGWKRITSGFLAFTIVSILILGNSGIAFAEEYEMCIRDRLCFL